MINMKFGGENINKPTENPEKSTEPYAVEQLDKVLTAKDLGNELAKGHTFTFVRFQPDETQNFAEVRFGVTTVKIRDESGSTVNEGQDFRIPISNDEGSIPETGATVELASTSAAAHDNDEGFYLYKA